MKLAVGTTVQYIARGRDPQAAIITKVIQPVDGMVNLMVFNDMGRSYPAFNVPGQWQEASATAPHCWRAIPNA